MPKRQKISINEHMLNLGSFYNWMRLLRKSRGVSRKYIPRALYITYVNLFIIFLRVYERLRYRKRINNTRVHPSPVFILGHWRSGTTHLHNIIAHDENLGYVTTFQGFAPDLLWVGGGFIKRKMKSVAPETRLIDNIKYSLDAPQEDEVAIANLLPYSILHMFSFPHLADEFEKYAIFDEEPGDFLNEWTEKFLEVLRKATYNMNNKRLVLKSPQHTGRIKTLLKLFPDAKFIHIHRNPYRVYLSTVRLYQHLMSRWLLREFDFDKIEEIVIRIYQKMMRKFLAEKKLIPPENFVEISFDDLEKNPMRCLQTIYDNLKLPGFAEAQPHFKAYIDSQANYQKLKYELSDDAIKKVNRYWAFALKEWGYKKIKAEN